MVVTEVKIKLVPRSDDKLLAFASITLDRCFVVRDIKVIHGVRTLFVAMPSRKITDRCPKCACKNHLQAQHCNGCGSKLNASRTRPDDRGRAKLHADIAHPINMRCRQDVQDAILREYQLEVERSKQPGYVPPAFDDFDAGPEDDGSTPSRTPPKGTPAVLRDPSNPPTNPPGPPGPASSQHDDTSGDGAGFGVFA